MADSGKGWSERVRTPQAPTGRKRRPKHLKPGDEGSYREEGSYGWAILGFFQPILGLILACVWRRTKPKSARAAGLGALAYFALLILLYVLPTSAGSTGFGSRYVETSHGNNTKALAVGYWGTCEWVVDRDGLLVVYPGEGEDNSGESPWRGHADDITTARFEEGVTLPKRCSGLLSELEELKSADLSACDTSEVDDMGYMFSGCSSLEELDISGWDTSKVEKMSCMFSGCSSLEGLDVSGWDTSEVKYTGRMFYGCSSLEGLDVSQWDTSSIENMSSMFDGCASLKSLDVSGWDTSKVRNLADMFSGCSSLEFLDMSGWDTSNAEGNVQMFFGYTSLSQFKVGDKYLFARSEFFPEATAENGKWYSTRDGAWYTVHEIVSRRSGVADTYTNGEEPAAEGA